MRVLRTKSSSGVGVEVILVEEVADKDANGDFRPPLFALEGMVRGRADK